MTRAKVRFAADPRFWSGAEQFARGEYFDAHETWEDVWREASGEEKVVLGALIQAAAGLLKHEQGNVNGMRRLLDRACRVLEAPPVDSPFDAEALAAELRVVRAAADAPVRARPRLLSAPSRRG